MSAIKELIDKLVKYGTMPNLPIPKELEDARAELAALTSELARMREALGELMGWIDGWEPRFLDDETWPETETKVRAALDGVK